MTMKFICDLSWDTKKMLERIYKQSSIIKQDNVQSAFY
jgi:hypothetical protein